MGSRWRRWRVGAATLLVAVGIVITVWSATAPPARAEADTGEVYVLNAVIGSPAIVLIDGRRFSARLAPQQILGPLELAAGRHVLALHVGTELLASGSFTVTAGSSTDVVAHRRADASMAPVITVFPNPEAPVGPGKARLLVSHVAVAEPADIRVDGRPLFRNVANGESLSVTVPAKGYSVDIVPTATAGPAILSPVRLTVAVGTLTRVFAVGNPADGTMDAVVQVLKIPVKGAAAPRLVRTGDGGQAALSFIGPARMWPFGLGTVLVGLALLVGSRRLVGGRSLSGGRHTL